jgi:citrate lyase beta subunit
MHTIRSLFFAPANRPALVGKFPRFVADCYVLDLEDGTPPGDKADALAGLSWSRAAAMTGGRSTRPWRRWACSARSSRSSTALPPHWRWRVRPT